MRRPSKTKLMQELNKEGTTMTETTAPDPRDLNEQDVVNVLNLMSRVELKGNEAQAYVTAEMKLKLMLKTLQATVGAGAAVDVGDGESGD